MLRPLLLLLPLTACHLAQPLRADQMADAPPSELAFAPTSSSPTEGAASHLPPPALDFAEPGRQDESTTADATASPVPAQAAPEFPPSQALPSGWHNPMPGGYIGGYAADTGLDIAGFKLPVYAVAAGTLIYAENGHTGWTGRGNTNFSVLIELDEPMPWRGRQITHAWYAHLSKLDVQQAEHAPVRQHIKAGQRLGISGFGNGSPHLHLGLLLDGGTEQNWGDYLLFDQVAAVLGPYPMRARLPRP